MPERPIRAPLHHGIPDWVEPGAIFFITVCARRRGRNTLACDPVGTGLLEAVAHYHRRQIWWVRLFLLMPDHVHALIAVAPDRRLDRTVRAWKSYAVQQFGIEWQSGFFDHRIRTVASLDEKAAYIRLNPVRAGLVAEADSWPWVWTPPEAPAVPW